LGSSTPRNEAMSPRLTSLSIAEGRALAAATEHAEVEVVVRPSDVLCKRGRPSALQRDPACALRLARRRSSFLIFGERGARTHGAHRSLAITYGGARWCGGGAERCGSMLTRRRCPASTT
jgi:hypothetical protein